MENELRYYLKQIKLVLESEDPAGKFVPTYMVTAVKLPTGAIELAVNNSNIPEKIDYVLDAYDENMCLKTNPDITMIQLMIV